MALRHWWLKRRSNGLSELQRSPKKYGGEGDSGRAKGSKKVSRDSFGTRENSSGGRPRPLQATAAGNVDTVKRLAQEGHSMEQTFKGWTPLMKAAEEGHCECLRALLEARARVDACNSKDK